MGLIIWLWVVGFIVEMVSVVGACLFCSLQGRFISEGLYKEGGVIIGGLFPVHVEAPEPYHAFTQIDLSLMVFVNCSSVQPYPDFLLSLK